MKIEQIREIANAVLYEGYLLYPYRHSAIKNRQRWTFGVVYPQEYSELNGGSEPWMMQTECLLAGDVQSRINIHVRFLHLLLRSVEQVSTQINKRDMFDGRIEDHWDPDRWEEGREREISVIDLHLHELTEQAKLVEIAFPRDRIVELTQESKTIREQQAINGLIRIVSEHLDSNLYRLRVQIENRTMGVEVEQQRRDAILQQSFISTHMILQIEQGAFISLLDPPQTLRRIAQDCQNLHTWPVLVGHEGESNAMLSSPIILYDYPQIAPESAGALFDGTEIDEILTLRIMTLSDEEKQEIKKGDERAREILERTETLTTEQLMKLHGRLRSLGSAAENERKESQQKDYTPPPSVEIAGHKIKAGSHVRLNPSARADAFDLLLAGKTARIETIQQDMEKRIYLVVTLDDDPAREQPEERVLPGHRFFFYPQEVELLEDAV